MLDSTSRRLCLSPLSLVMSQISAVADAKLPTRRCALERVLQQIHHRRRKQLRIPVDSQGGIDRVDGERDVAVLGMQQPRGSYFVEERDHWQSFAQLSASRKANFGQCAVDDVPQACEAAAEYRPGAAVYRDVSSLQRLEGKERTIENVSKFVSGLPETFDFFD